MGHILTLARSRAFFPDPGDIWARSKFEKAATGIPAGKVTNFCRKAQACPVSTRITGTVLTSNAVWQGIETWQPLPQGDFSVTNVRNYIDAVNRRRKHKGQF